MSLKHHVTLYANVNETEPLAFAVYNTPEKAFEVKGATIFPLAVAVRLTERIRINKMSGETRWKPRYDFGGEPYPCVGGLALLDPRSESWIRWEPDDKIEMRQSIHFMLQECADRDLCGFRLDLKQDWSKPGFRAEMLKVKPRPSKLTVLKWLSAWQLPYWEREDIPNCQRFERIQTIATAYGIKGWTSLTNFESRLAEIKGA
jgi:hypothetical protein